MSSLTELIRGTNLNQITDKALQINTTQIKKTFTELSININLIILNYLRV